jgi:hypothetical protein
VDRHVADESRHAATERATERRGELLLQTAIEIRGDPSKGPVPVKVAYRADHRQTIVPSTT